MECNNNIMCIIIIEVFCSVLENGLSTIKRQGYDAGKAFRCYGVSYSVT